MDDIIAYDFQKLVAEAAFQAARKADEVALQELRDRGFEFWRDTITHDMHAIHHPSMDRRSFETGLEVHTEKLRLISEWIFDTEEQWAAFVTQYEAQVAPESDWWTGRE